MYCLRSLSVTGLPENFKDLRTFQGRNFCFYTLQTLEKNLKRSQNALQRKLSIGPMILQLNHSVVKSKFNEKNIVLPTVKADKISL